MLRLPSSLRATSHGHFPAALQRAAGRLHGRLTRSSLSPTPLSSLPSQSYSLPLSHNREAVTMDAAPNGLRGAGFTGKQTSILGFFGGQRGGRGGRGRGRGVEREGSTLLVDEQAAIAPENKAGGEVTGKAKNATEVVPGASEVVKKGGVRRKRKLVLVEEGEGEGEGEGKGGDGGGGEREGTGRRQGGGETERGREGEGQGEIEVGAESKRPRTQGGDLLETSGKVLEAAVKEVKKPKSPNKVKKVEEEGDAESKESSESDVEAKGLKKPGKPKRLRKPSVLKGPKVPDAVLREEIEVREVKSREATNGSGEGFFKKMSKPTAIAGVVEGEGVRETGFMDGEGVARLEEEKSSSSQSSEGEDDDGGELLSEAEEGVEGEELAVAVEGEREGEEKRGAKGVRGKKQGERPRKKAKTGGKTGGENRVGDGLHALALKHAEYDPGKSATWKPGEPVPFLFLAKALEEISKLSGRLAMTELLCNVFRTVMETTPADLLPVVYLAANRVAPPHEGVELGIGDASIIRALAEATGRKEAQVKADYKESGDLGLVARASRTTQRTMFAPQPLSCAKVLETFRFIAKETGKESSEKKRARMKQLIVAARETEPQFIVRLLQGKMRIGLAEQTVLAALAQASVLQEKPPVPPAELPGRLEEAIRLIKAAYSVLPVYEKIISVILEGGIRSLPEKCKFTPGIPVGPMLAKPTRGISEILDKFQDCVFTCEYKYDGERAQIHYLEGGIVEIYSRNAERNTGKYPDIVAAMTRYKKPHISSFVLDAEVVAYDRENDKILPFQILSTRARKGVIVGDITVRVCLFAFDLLHLNGRDLLKEQLKERRELLYGSFDTVKGEFQFATAVTTSAVEEMQTFLDDAVNHGCEGAMVKTLEHDATYEPAKRSNNWLKLKKDYMDGLGDSLDLVPIGAFHGRGKRAGVYGAFLLACYDDVADEYQSICKIGTGFSEAVLEERSRALSERIIPKPRSYYRYGETLGAEVWFEPAEVWECRAADLSISPVHRAANGTVDSNKGIALRFPRFLRVRPDKAPEQATSAQQVAEMYRSQKIHNLAKGGEDAE